MGLGSQWLLQMASGVLFTGVSFSSCPSLVVAVVLCKSLSVCRVWSLLCNSVIGNGLGAVSCWSVPVRPWVLLVIVCSGVLSGFCMPSTTKKGLLSSKISIWVGCIVKLVVPFSNMTSWDRKTEPVSLRYSFERFRSAGIWAYAVVPNGRRCDTSCRFPYHSSAGIEWGCRLEGIKFQTYTVV